MHVFIAGVRQERPIREILTHLQQGRFHRPQFLVIEQACALEHARVSRRLLHVKGSKTPVEVH